MRFSGELLVHLIFIQSGEFIYQLGKCPFSKTGAITEELLLYLLDSFCYAKCTDNKYVCFIHYIHLMKQTEKHL